MRWVRRHTQCSAAGTDRLGSARSVARRLDAAQRRGGWAAFLIIANGLFYLSFLHQGQFTIGRQTRMQPAAATDGALLWVLKCATDWLAAVGSGGRSCSTVAVAVSVCSRPSVCIVAARAIEAAWRRHTASVARRSVHCARATRSTMSSVAGCGPCVG